MDNPAADLEARLTRLAVAAARGDAEATEQLAEGMAELTRAPRATGWPTPGRTAFMVFNAFVNEPQSDTAMLRRLVGPFLDAITAHPETLGVPHDFRPAETLGVEAIPHLARTLDRALGATSRAEIQALGKFNLMNAAGLGIAASILERLFAYAGAEEEVAEALLALPWTDERMWLLFCILAGGNGPFTNPRELGDVARAVLPRLVAATASIEGPGTTKLLTALLRAKVIPKALARGVVLTKLPKQLPIEVKDALALLETWGLSRADVDAGPPAKARDLAALEEKIGRKLPRDLVLLLSTHGSIGDREIGPPRRMKQLIKELEGTIEDDEEEADDAPSGKGRYDVRGFDPMKTGIPLGTDVSGDMYFLATRAKSEAGTAPVIRYRHDQALVAAIAADSLGEYVAILFARVYARREGLGPELDKLEERKRQIVSGYKPKSSKTGGTSSGKQARRRRS